MKLTAGVEAKRLARIRELARAHRKTGRALERALAAGLARGIGVRKLAAAAGLSHSTVWRLTRAGSEQPGLAAGEVKLPPKRGGNAADRPPASSRNTSEAGTRSAADTSRRPT